MGENVFSQLRKLARVGDEVQRLQEMMARRDEDDDRPGAAASLLYLRRQRDDVHNLATSAKSDLSSLQQSRGEVDKLVPLFQSFLSHQSAAVSALEDYLMQYGYQPKSQAVKKQISRESERGEEQEEEELTSSTNEKFTMEDFGLSQARVSAISRKDYSTAFGVPDVRTSSHVTSGVPQAAFNGNNTTVLSYLQDERGPYADYWPTTETKVPASFRQPVQFTPSVFNGRLMPTMTPEMHQGAALGFRQLPIDMTTTITPRQNILQRLSSCTSDDSPVPPAFTTPGLKLKPQQLQSCNLPPYFSPLSADSPIPPVPLTSGLRPRHAQTTRDQTVTITTQSDMDDKSPIPPVMMTPGLKQIVKVQETEKEETNSNVSPALPVFMTAGLNKKMKGLTVETEGENSSKENTPNLPTYTTPYLNRHQHHHNTNGTTTATPTTTYNNGFLTSGIGDTPKTPEFSEDCTAFLHIPNEALTSFTVPASQVEDTPDDETLCLKGSGAGDLIDNMASPPDNTIHFLHSKRADIFNNNKKTSATTTATTATATDPRSDPLKDPGQRSTDPLPDLDDELPPPPRLTLTLNNQDTKLPSTNHITKPASCDQPTANHQPRQVTEKREVNGSSDVDIPRIVPLLDEEYDLLPKYIRSQLRLDIINQAIAEINVLLEAKARGGGAMFLLEEDLTILDLERKTNTFCLALINAKRIATGLLNTDRVFTVLPRAWE